MKHEHYRVTISMLAQVGGNGSMGATPPEAAEKLRELLDETLGSGSTGDPFLYRPRVEAIGDQPAPVCMCGEFLDTPEEIEKACCKWCARCR